VRQLLERQRVPFYRPVVQQSLEQLLDWARLIGPQTGSWAEAMV
jgi:hypothetical protein